MDQRQPSQRQLRVGEEIRHILAEILERGNIRDPDVANRPVTVTEVSVSPDLRNASVYVIPLGGGDCLSLLAGLKRVRSFLRHEIGRALRLRLVPDLTFFADQSFDTASRIEALLKSPAVCRDLSHDAEPPKDDSALEDGDGA